MRSTQRRTIFCGHAPSFCNFFCPFLRPCRRRQRCITRDIENITYLLQCFTLLCCDTLIIITRVSEVIMFSPCVFVTCQNFQFWQVCSSDGLCVCLSVCLSVCNVDDTGRTVKVINTKLYKYMYLGSGYMCIVLGVDDVIDDVIRFTNRSNFEIAITPSIFELERRTKS